MENILVVDDNLTICLMLKSWLIKKDYNVDTASNVADAIGKVKSNTYDLILSDIRMPDEDGFYFLEWIKRYDTSIQMIMMTSFADIESAVESIKMGAFDYIPKPIDADALFSKIEEAFKKSEIDRRHKELDQEFVRPEGLEIEENHDKMISAINERLHLLIMGDNGTGKSTAAKFIYIKNTQINGPFVVMDMAEPSFESDKVTDDLHFRNYFEKARGGLLYIKGFKKASIQFQTLLLDALTKQSRDDDYTQIVISTSNSKSQIKDYLVPKLADKMLELCLLLPSIRGNKKAIISFSEAFLKMANRELNKKILSISNEVYDVMYEQKWEGNIQELKNMVFKMVLLTEGDTINTDIIPLIKDKPKYLYSNMEIFKDGSLEGFKRENFEKKKIEEALSIAKGNKTLAATILNIDRKTLYNKIRLYEI